MKLIKDATGSELSVILAFFPSEYLNAPVGRMTGLHWAKALVRCPLLAGVCPWDKLDSFDLSLVLQAHPKLACHFDPKKICFEDMERICR